MLSVKVIVFIWAGGGDENHGVSVNIYIIGKLPQ